MAAPQNQSDIVRFPFNVPQLVSVKFAKPRMIDSKFGERAMFSLTDGRVMFLEPRVAESIAMLDIHPGEEFYIAKRSTKDRGEYWDVWLPPNVERLKGAGGSCDIIPPVPQVAKQSPVQNTIPVSIHAPQGARTVQNTIPQAQAQWAQEILEHAKVKLTMYHELCGWARTNLEGITRNEVRAILMNCLISMEKGGRR